jgi:predicted DNA-binding transcriptional regulator AlpA
MMGVMLQTPSPDATQSPDDVLSPRHVREKLDLSATTIWRMERAGTFPRAIRLSPGRCGYLRRDIEAWIAARIEAAGR